MLSVIVITKDEERNIDRCLASVQWADEIIVVDAESSDKTREIAESYRAKVVIKKWEGYSIQKEYAMMQAVNTWVLSLDADEEVTPELRKEVQDVIVSNNAFDGYEIPRKSFFLGKWIQYGGWYPGFQIRLFRKSKIRMNHRPVHEGFVVDGLIGRLTGNINHFTYRSLHQYLEKMNDYSSLDVANKLATKKRIYWFNFILNPLSAFLRMYVSLKGYKDGYLGFLLSSYSALHVLAIYSKTWEYQFAAKKNIKIPPTSSEEIAKIKGLTG